MKRAWWRRVGILTLGWILILLGIVGLALPVLQGVLLILLGLLVLSRESHWAGRQLARLRRRFPRADARLHEYRERLVRRFPFFGRR